MNAIGKTLRKSFFLRYLWILTKESRKPIDLQSISTFLPGDLPKEEQRKLKRRLRVAVMKYGVTPSEYYIFHFDTLKARERSSFVGTHFGVALKKQWNDSQKAQVFRDKYLCYQTFQRFYGRELLCVQSEQDMDKVTSFIKRHDRVVIKPKDGSQGTGVFAADVNDLPGCLAKIASCVPCVMEEYIRQDEKLAAFHPQSVNTVRVLTFTNKGKTNILYSFLRTGSGESQIDNASAGGICAEIDKKTGIILTDGYRENNKVYKKHPDTGVDFQGTQIPCWDELIKTVKEVAKVEPAVRLVGWDFALSRNGWVMVEGNDMPAFIAIQMCRRKGLKKELIDVIRHTGQ